MLVKSGFLDRDYRIDSDKEHLFFPLMDTVPLEGFFKLLNTKDLEVVPHSVQIRPKKTNFKHLMTDTLPENLHPFIPSSFDLIGKIAILKLHPEMFSHKEAIGKGIIASTSARAVYLKTDDVGGKYRIPKLELIAGEPLEETIHNEHGMKLFVNVKKAFFNPRLANEHQRIANLVTSDESVIDFFTGIGPFAIMIAKRIKATVHAVDINSDAIRCLKESLSLNRLQGDVYPVVGDINDIHKVLPRADRVIMNLPGQARDYLKVAFKMIKKGGFIHYYSFSPKNALDPVEAVYNDVHTWLVLQNHPGKIRNAFKLREVSVSKFQVAIDIQRK
jgi:tRNA (guanine37-N1)-methyltransferase